MRTAKGSDAKDETPIYPDPSGREGSGSPSTKNHLPQQKLLNVDWLKNRER